MKARLWKSVEEQPAHANREQLLIVEEEQLAKADEQLTKVNKEQPSLG